MSFHRLILFSLNLHNRYVDAVEPLERGLAIHTGDLWARANLDLSLAWSCQWEKNEYHMAEFSRQLEAALIGEVVSYPSPAHMLLIISHSVKLASYRQWVDLWVKEQIQQVDTGMFFNSYPLLPRDRRLRPQRHPRGTA